MSENTLKIVTVIGARPQFVKAAVVSRAIARCPDLDEVIVHTGQHYDESMSQVFFDELGIPRPACNLHIGSASHGKQTGAMLADLEQVFLNERPACVLVYGDTNSTLAGAIAAAKLHIPVAHVEAGLRSFNRRMPEEINRVLTDHASDLLLCPTEAAVGNLAREGISENVHLIGDVMYDAAMLFAGQAEQSSQPPSKFNVADEQFVLMTCHRAENTDDPAKLASIVHAAGKIGEEIKVLFPVHPRTRGRLCEYGGKRLENIELLEPLSYLQMLHLEQHAAVILTDSGGVQKEAFFFGVPCVTLRDETEWGETVATGANILAGSDSAAICNAFKTQLQRQTPLPDAAPYYGNGRAAAKTAGLIEQWIRTRDALHKVDS